MPRAIILVIDGFGIGHAPDAEAFGDVSANTFANMATAFAQQKQRHISLPNLSKLGLVKACQQASDRALPVKGDVPTIGAYGYAAQISSGKGTPSGHWEMAGVPVLFDWTYFAEKEHGFPKDLIDKINQATGFSGFLGNCHASTTHIIAELGAQHLETGLPICYTSADSVFQIAAHEEHFGLESLYNYCEQVSEILDEYNIGSVIARPFTGNNKENFQRTGNRRDYSVLPPATTVLEKLTNAGGTVVSIGKIADIFAHQGISIKAKANGIAALTDTTLAHLNVSQTQSPLDNTIIFTHLVNLEQDFGHRRDPVGYGEALEYFDSRLPEFFAQMSDDDLLLLTSDHGCDPTWPGNDHTREFVPVLAYHNHIKSINLAQRNSFADLGQTLAELFKLEAMDYGKSFLTELAF